MEIKSTADFARMTRSALAAAGLVRQQTDGAVWWSGGSPDAPPLVLIHGANDHAGTWFTVVPALTGRYHVIIPDLAGHGESEPRSGAIPISLVLEQLHAVIGGRQNVTLVGNSFGGWMVILYALRHPGEVARLVLETSGGLNRPLAIPVMAQDRTEALTILRAVHGPAFQPPEWAIEGLLQRGLDSPLLRITETTEHLIESRLCEIRTPTTLVWGADDGVLPLSYAEELRQAIAGARLHVIEGAAHIPHMQQPARFLECLTSTS